MIGKRGSRGRADLEGLMGEVRGLAQCEAGAGTGCRGTVQTKRRAKVGPEHLDWPAVLGRWGGETGEDNGWTKRVTRDGRDGPR